MRFLKEVQSVQSLRFVQPRERALSFVERLEQLERFEQ